MRHAQSLNGEVGGQETVMVACDALDAPDVSGARELQHALIKGRYTPSYLDQKL